MTRLIGLLAAAVLLAGVGGLLPGPATSARAPAVAPGSTEDAPVARTAGLPGAGGREVRGA